MGKKRGERRHRPHVVHGPRLARKAGRIHLPHRGIRVLIGYMAALAIVELFYIIAEILHPDLSVSPALLAIDVFMAATLVAIIFGLLARSAWAWICALAWFSFAIVYLVILISFFHQQIFLLAQGLVGIALALGVVLNGIIIWYLYEKREYFTLPGYHEHAGHDDMVFSYLMITFWVLVFAIGITAGSTVYFQIKERADRSIVELSLMPFSGTDAKISHCLQKQEGRDICLLVLTALEKDRTICARMYSDLYHFVCKRI